MPQVDVIATTISGSISDWKKVERIVPLFKQHGFGDVRLHEVDSHKAARQTACEVLKSGSRYPISAGGSGTFRAVLEGCMDSQADLSEIRLGFLRKGSADLIGKVLNMPDDIEQAVEVFAQSIRSDIFLPADVLKASSPESDEDARHFIGYGGAELFGRIPHYTENRYTKMYKGILSQLFGDLGPFTTGMVLSLMEKIIKTPFKKRTNWQIIADGNVVLEGRFQAIIIVNGYLGPDLAFSDKPLGSGEFYVFALRDMGTMKLISQCKQARNGTIMNDPQKWGLESVTVTDKLELACDLEKPFQVNIDGGTFIANRSMVFERVAQVPLITKKH